MTQNESKYYNTACLMDEALIQLINEKDYDYITITEICKRAGVNRSTFYLHYETVDDLLKEAIKKIDDDFNSHMQGFGTNRDLIIDAINNERTYELSFINEKYLYPYLNYLKEHQKIYSISFKNPQILGSDEKYKALKKDFFNPILNAFRVPKDIQKYIFSYHFSGVTAIIKCWLNDGCSDSIEVVCNIITKCIKRD